MEDVTKVFVLTVSHRNLDTITVHRTKEGAYEELYDFVSTWWKKEMGEEEMPIDHLEAIDRYFEVVNVESANVEECKVQD